MTDQEIIDLTISHVKKELSNAEGGHNWFHIERVYKNTLGILKSENVDYPIVAHLGALLHDIADSKFHNGDESIGPRKTRAFLESLGLDENIINETVFIVENISYKGGHNEHIEKTKELMVVQDADRLDAIGAIGIARCFNYGGFKNRPIYHPDYPAKEDMTKEEYKNNPGPSVNHFYEKLLKLKDLMNTDTGRKMAQQRHEFMESYLKQLYLEIE